jgi:hypothetical protein
VTDGDATISLFWIDALTVAGTVSQWCQRVGQWIGFGLVLQESIGITSCFKNGGVPGRQCLILNKVQAEPEGLANKLQLSSDLMHIPTGLGCRVADV